MARALKRQKTDELQRRNIHGEIEVAKNNFKSNGLLVECSDEGLGLVCLEIHCPTFSEDLQDIDGLGFIIGNNGTIFITSGASIESSAIRWKISICGDGITTVQSLRRIIETLKSTTVCKVIVDDQVRVEVRVYAKEAAVNSIKDVSAFIANVYLFLGEIEENDLNFKGTVAKCILDRERINKSDQIQHPRMAASLYHYQIECVDWMLEREGIRIDESGNIQTISIPPIPLSIPVGASLDLNLLDFTITADNGNEKKYDHIRGGLLNDEMGLVSFI